MTASAPEPIHDITLPHCASCGAAVDLSKLVTAAALRVNLTAKETLIFTYVLKGFSTTEMAELLQISDKNIKHHISTIFHKFDVNSRMELCAEVFPT